MIKNKFRPANFNGDLVKAAKGIAEIVLRGHLFVKAMCGKCQGLGRLELISTIEPANSKFCEKCNGTGKQPYTLNEKIDIAGFTLTKTNYIKSYQKYELIGESIVTNGRMKLEDVYRDYSVSSCQNKLLNKFDLDNWGYT
jgi:hypothetical protein